MSQKGCEIMCQKSVAVINDIAGYGRCSLTVALPIISAMGVKASAIPTAVLSTHTAFDNNTFCDLTDCIIPISKHWENEKFKFDYVYSGYLCNEKQVDAVFDAICNISDDTTKVIVDPVIGDNGKEYRGFTKQFPSYLLKLLKKADIITPNVTEACMLTGEIYLKNYDAEYIEMLARKLYSVLGASVVLTGVTFGDGKIGAAIFDGRDINYVFSDEEKGYFHGTGDIFTSVFIGAVANGKNLVSAAQIAADFVSSCIKQTVFDGTDTKFGLNFEKLIPNLIRAIQ